MAEDGHAGPVPGRGGSGRQTYRSSAHLGSLLDGLLALRRGGLLQDVVLLVEGRPLPAHRVLLAASCHYFRGMFAGGLREALQKEIPIHGVSYTAMKKLLDYIYTSEIELDLECVQDVLRASTLVQLDAVVGFCCDFLSSRLDESNVVAVHQLADAYGLQQLRGRLHAFVVGNIRALSRTEAYRQLPEDEVFRALSSNELQVDGEDEVYEAALRYHCEDQADEHQVALQDNPRMLDAVRFCLMERRALQRLDERLDACPLKGRLAAALRYHQQEVQQPVLQGPLSRPRSTLRCILCFGGVFSSAPKGGENSFQVFRPTWGEWKTLAAAPPAQMSNQGVAVLSNFVYLIGGDQNAGGFRAETRCWRYDPRHDSWCSVQPLQRRRSDHCVCVLGGHIYAVGGRDYQSELNSVERYDPHANAWEFVSPLKREVFAHAGAVLAGKIYITCGLRGTAYHRETFCFDPAANDWTACAEGPVERAWHGAAAVDGRLYVIGGSNNERTNRRDVLKVACFDPELDSWSLVAPLPAGHGEPGVAVLDGRIYVLGGRSHDKGKRMKYVHAYDVAADAWGGEMNFKGCVSGLAACAVLMPPAVIAKARSWEQRSKASWVDGEAACSEESGED